jgi:hypothetical protein
MNEPYNHQEFLLGDAFRCARQGGSQTERSNHVELKRCRSEFKKAPAFAVWNIREEDTMKIKGFINLWSALESLAAYQTVNAQSQPPLH